MARSRLGELPPQAFENDPPVLNPTVIDSHYSADYLARRGQLLERIQRVRHNVEKYSPDQPRDEDGKWTRGGGTRTTGRNNPKLSRRGAAWFSKDKLLAASAKAASSIGIGAAATAGVDYLAEHLLHLCHSYAALGGGLALSALAHSLIENAASVLGLSPEKAKEFLNHMIDNLIAARKSMVGKADDGDEVLDFLYGLKGEIQSSPEQPTNKSNGGASNLRGTLHKPSRFVETGEGLIIEPPSGSSDGGGEEKPKPLPRYRPRKLRIQED